MIPEHGLFPAGRYRSARDEIHARLVDGCDQRRAESWRHGELATTLLGHHVPINAARLHGTFSRILLNHNRCNPCTEPKTSNSAKRASTRSAGCRLARVRDAAGSAPDCRCPGGHSNLHTGAASPTSRTPTTTMRRIFTAAACSTTCCNASRRAQLEPPALASTRRPGEDIWR